MTDFASIKKLLWPSALKSLAVGLVFLTRSLPLVSQSIPESRLAQQHPGDRLVLWGGFDRADHPVLEFTQLVRAGENPVPPAGYPAFGVGSGGQILISDQQKKSVFGKWTSVKRKMVSIPGGSVELGEGWVAESPYLPGALSYRLRSGGRDLGGERFLPATQAQTPTGTLKRAFSKYPVDSGSADNWPSDVEGIPAQPIQWWWWEILAPGGFGPHGTWLCSKDDDGYGSKIQVFTGAAVVDWPGTAKAPGAPKESTSFKAGWPDQKGPSVIRRGTNNPGHYPIKLEGRLRRSYGLQILEDHLEFEAGSEPPLGKAPR